MKTQHFKIGALALVAFGALFVGAFAITNKDLIVGGQSQTAQVSSTASDRLVVRGTSILRNGEPFIMKGTILGGFGNRMEDLLKCSDEPYCTLRLAMRDYYFGRGDFADPSRDALVLAKEWGMNTIRLAINQAALDPQHASYSVEYLLEIHQATTRARKQGYIVILGLFDNRGDSAPEILSAANPGTPLNNETSLRAAKTLARTFGHDEGVIIELLNEVFSPGVARKKGWILWRDGGTVTEGRYAGRTFVGVNEIIKTIRSTGARNVVIVQLLGANAKGFPGGVVDPLNKIVYSAHPFFRDGKPADINWDVLFGTFAQTHPFVITAWNAPTGSALNKWCEAAGIDLPSKFLSYIGARNIGVIGYSFSVPNSIVKDFRTHPGKPTVLPADCSSLKSQHGPGEILKQHFLSA